MSQEKSDFIEFCKFSDNDFICFQNSSSEYSDVDSFHKQKFLSCDLGLLHLNIASLNKYRDELESFLNVLNYKFRLIGVTEHKLGINDFLHFHYKILVLYTTAELLLMEEQALLFLMSFLSKKEMT